MKQRILIVGKSFKNLENYLVEHGYDFTVLRDKSIANPKTRLPANWVMCDFSEKHLVIDCIKSLKDKFEGAIAIYENYILPTSWITEYLGLPGLPVEAAKACTDKQLMRLKFANSTEQISPDFAEVKSATDLQEFAKTHSFPLILKPANLAKSLLVTKNHNLSELLANYDKALATIDVVYKKYAPHRPPKLLVEEFLDGSIHSVDAFIGEDGKPQVLKPIVDYQTGYDIGHEDNFHYSRVLPTNLSEIDQQQLRRVAGLGCEALGMKNTPAHIEIIMTKLGPKIVEIGARNGGYRQRMHTLANGIDITGAWLDVIRGLKPNITPLKNDHCAVLELFPKKAGIFKSIAHESELRKLPSLSYLSIKPRPGDLIGLAGEGHKTCAVIILHNPDATQFYKDLEFINQNVTVEIA